MTPEEQSEAARLWRGLMTQWTELPHQEKTPETAMAFVKLLDLETVYDVYHWLRTYSLHSSMRDSRGITVWASPLVDAMEQTIYHRRGAERIRRHRTRSLTASGRVKF